MTNDIKERLAGRIALNQRGDPHKMLRDALQRIEELEAAMKAALKWLDKELPISAATELESALGEDYD